MKWYFFTLGALGLLMMACEEDRTEELKAQLIQERVEERVNRVVETRRMRCTAAMFKEANRIVDSILIAQAKSNKDSIPKPPKPSKPDRPIPISPSDSATIEELQLDSILTTLGSMPLQGSSDSIK